MAVLRDKTLLVPQTHPLPRHQTSRHPQTKLPSLLLPLLLTQPHQSLTLQTPSSQTAHSLAMALNQQQRQRQMHLQSRRKSSARMLHGHVPHSRRTQQLLQMLMLL